MTSSPEEPLLLDVQEDLERIDRVMSQVIGDPATADEFVRDPNGVLTRLGMHPRTTRDIHDRVNRVFYAVLTNTDLLEFLAEHFQSFALPGDEQSEVQRDALRRGEIEHSTSLDMAALNHCIRDPEVVRRIYGLTLGDLNRRRLLMRTYSTDELDEYVGRLVEAIAERRPIRDTPVLEEWDAQYGVGNRMGVGFHEVGPIVSVAAVVELAVWATVWLGVDSDVVVKAQSEALAQAVKGDLASARTLATASAIMHLAGEVMLHANGFERS